MAKYAKDCNNDGVVDCIDYAMMHLNGGPLCGAPLSESTYGRDFLKGYLKCKLY